MSLSAIMAMEMRAAECGDVASLCIGLPSFETPLAIRSNVEQALRDDPAIGKYTLSDGLPELRERVAEFHQARCDLPVDPDRQVLITAGNMQGLNLLLHVLLAPGDEVIITDPGFPSHIEQVHLCGGNPVFWQLDEAAGWALDPERLAGLITARTKAIILVTPSNPTGKVFAKEDLAKVAEMARSHGFMVLVDDPYCHFVYEGSRQFVSPASLPQMADHLCYLYSFSKAHAMTGWRLGYMVIPAALKHAALKVHDATLICAPRISQAAGLAALSSYQDYLPAFRETLARRRRLICRRLDRVPHVFEYNRPEGAYYVFPRIVADHRSSQQFADDLLATAKVLVTPGQAFGPAGEHHVRLAFCVADATIESAFDRIEQRYPA